MIKIVTEQNMPDSYDILMISADKLKKNSYIDANVEEQTIRVAAKFIQDTIVEKIIGSCLYNQLLQMICDNKVTGNYKILLVEYLHPIFTYGIPGELSIPLSFKNRNIGTFQVQGSDVKSTDLDELKYINQWYKNKMNFYMSRAMEYICKNRDCFAMYCCPCDSRPSSGTGSFSSINIY